MTGPPLRTSGVAGGPPTATYRVQLTQEHGFAALAQRAPYLAALGVSHAYLSPILATAPRSQHGYDVVDHGRVDEELGGESGLRATAAELARHGIGLLVDVVPNHMARPVPEYLNGPLWAFLRDGPQSPYATWFDVEGGGTEPMVLPILGRPLDECLDDEEITLDRRGGPNGEPVLRYLDHALPVRPGTEDLPLPDLVAAQHYRPSFWRVGAEELNYRRFFDVDALVAVRVEDHAVFEATHAVLLRLVSDGVVQGLRVDHPDGLAAPREYLERLAAATGGCYVVVEKILEEGEELPADWACAGTTGYDALAVVTHLFVDAAGGGRLREAFADVAEVDEGWGEASARARRELLAGPLVADVDRLARLAHAVCLEDPRLRDHSLRGLTEAVLELLAEVPVYRAYVEPGRPAPATSVSLLDGAAEAAATRVPHRTREIRLLRDLALSRLGRSARKDELCVRFQQTSGPAMAKGVEDTACYRWFPLTSLAEVGVRPDRFGTGVRDLHAWASARVDRSPYAMSTLSTHDTKRSEDVRARLAVLTELPDAWVAAVRQWRGLVGELGDGPLEWLLWQSVVGAWPIDAGRLSAYVVKAAREARTHTSWTDPDHGYERLLDGYVRRVLAHEDVVAGVSRLVDRLHDGFVANCLGQKALQLLLPGVPDVYQGCERVSLRLVDPDNREPPDAHTLGATLDRAHQRVPDPRADLDAAKVRLTSLALRLRRERPWLADASYEPLQVTGPGADHAVAFARGGEVAVVSSRLVLRLAEAGGWEDTRVVLPAGRWRDLLDEKPHVATGGGVAVAGLLSWPVALLVREDG